MENADRHLKTLNFCGERRSQLRGCAAICLSRNVMYKTHSRRPTNEIGFVSAELVTPVGQMTPVGLIITNDNRRHHFLSGTSAQVGPALYI